MASHAAPKPSPYSIAAGAVAYSLAATFHKHLPVDLIAAAPAAVVALVSAVERGVADAAAVLDKVDPKLVADVAKDVAPVNRLAAQAAGAAKDVQAAVLAGSTASAL